MSTISPTLSLSMSDATEMMPLSDAMSNRPAAEESVNVEKTLLAHSLKANNKLL